MQNRAFPLYFPREQGNRRGLKPALRLLWCNKTNRERDRPYARLARRPARHARPALEVGPDDWRGPALLSADDGPGGAAADRLDLDDFASGVRNVAPYSYFNLMGSDPFYVAFGSTGVKDSLTNLREVPEFVANIVSMDLLGADELHLDATSRATRTSSPGPA